MVVFLRFDDSRFTLLSSNKFRILPRSRILNRVFRLMGLKQFVTRHLKRACRCHSNQTITVMLYAYSRTPSVPKLSHVSGF